MADDLINCVYMMKPPRTLNNGVGEFPDLFPHARRVAQSLTPEDKIPVLRPFPPYVSLRLAAYLYSLFILYNKPVNVKCFP